MMGEKWIQVEPTKYDEPHEVAELEMEPGFFISPYDVPDGIRVTYDGDLFGIYLNYLTDEEESRRSKSGIPDLDLWFGKHSDRMIGMETNSLPAWDEVMDTLSAARIAGEPLRRLDGPAGLLAGAGGRNQKAPRSTRIGRVALCDRIRRHATRRSTSSGWPICSERPRTPSGSRGRRRR
jgi:hypothetical protein